MKGTSIGIKLADGSFYPILQEGVPARKKLELTTVRDNQTKVQVHLFKSPNCSMDDAEYVDTLVVENLTPRPRQVPSIALSVSLDENDVLSAEVSDAESGKHSDLKVSLQSLPQDEIFDLPDFSFSPGPPEENGLSGDSFAESQSSFEGLYDPPEEKRKISRPVIICVICAVISILVLVAVLLVTGVWGTGLLSGREEYMETETAVSSELPPVTGTVPAQPELSEPPPVPESVPAAPAVENQVVIVEAPVVEPAKPEPPAKAPEGTRYKIKWGDTLWDISYAYYKDPWLYKKIARANDIRNPDLIISGTYITIPPR